MRGVIPKIAIIGKDAEDKIALANAGILVLRPKNSKIAKALYFYFLSKDGQERLRNFYLNHNERVSEKEIKTLEISTDFLDSIEIYQNDFKKLCEYGEMITKYENAIKETLGF